MSFDGSWNHLKQQQTCVAQVETSLQSSFQPGMKLEVANRSSPDSYWVASIITTCGQLLLLRFSGYGDDRKADFWCDVMTAELHPVGWCALNNKTLAPPEGRHERCGEPGQGVILKGPHQRDNTEGQKVDRRRFDLNTRLRPAAGSGFVSDDDDDEGTS